MGFELVGRGVVEGEFAFAVMRAVGLGSEKARVVERARLQFRAFSSPDEREAEETPSAAGHCRCLLSHYGVKNNPVAALFSGLKLGVERVR